MEQESAIDAGPGEARPDPPGARGLLRISEFGPRPTGRTGRRHVTAYVPGPRYEGLADTDLRGFPDGGYSHPWNQPRQTHVRVGRSGPEHVRLPRYGEHEVFRALHRWDGVRLPPHSRVRDATIELTVQEPCPQPLRVLLYELRRDWSPGSGGVREDDLSPPREGESWWLDAAYGRSAWALPGAAFAAREVPDADTDLMPLARADYAPGDRALRFTSAELAAYIGRRVAAGEPLLFLFKLPDHQEDVPGLQLGLHSAEYGDARETGRRPRLTLGWESDAELRCLEHRVHLEHGRSWGVPPIAGDAERWVAVSFASEPGYEPPAVEWMEDGSGDASGIWTPIVAPFVAGPGPLRIRVSALSNRIPLGHPFVAGFRDNWVVTGPAEDQAVLWRFTAPSGRTHTMRSEYRGGFRWEVRFEPDEPGRWRYRWFHRFYEPGRVDSGPVGHFDVVAEEIGPIRDQLLAMVREVAAQRAGDGTRLDSLAVRFHALERAAVRCVGPGGRLDGSHGVLRAEINAVRSAFWGRPVPEPYPLIGMRLCRKLDGRTLRDPIPKTRHLSRSRSTGIRKRVKSGLRRLPGAAAAVRVASRVRGHIGHEVRAGLARGIRRLRKRLPGPAWMPPFIRRTDEIDRGSGRTGGE